MGQNQQDGGWQSSRGNLAYAASPDEQERHQTSKTAALEAIDSHYKKEKTPFSNNSRNRTFRASKTRRSSGTAKTRSYHNKKRRTRSRKRTIGTQRMRSGQSSKRFSLPKTTVMKTAVAAVFLCSFFFLGRGIGMVTHGTIPTTAELLAQTDNWGLGFGAEGTQPSGNVSAEELAKYDAWYVGDAKEKVLYLTFDAGYENGNTEPILDALKKHNAPATFFVVGHYLETAPELVKRMVAEGHTIGNHTWHHPDMSSISSKETFSEEMNLVEEKYKELTGEELVKFYRPPQGKYNLENLKMAQEMGYQTFFWSLAYVDWYQDKQPSHEEAFEKLTKRIHPGAIVLLHSTSKTNGEILDELLTKWEGMGYSFQPLSALVEGTAASSNKTGGEAVTH